MTEHELLTALARRKGRERPLAGPVAWDPGPSLPAVSPEWGLDALWERFALELEKLGGRPYRAATLADARAYVVRASAEAARRAADGSVPPASRTETPAAPAGSGEGGQGGGGAPAARAGARPVVVATADPAVLALGLDAALGESGLDLALWGSAAPDDPGAGAPEASLPAQAKHLAARAVAGITGVDWAVAETGTLLLGSGPGRGRVVSLLPPVHIALIRPSQLLPSLAEAFRRAGQALDLPSSLVLITGPSRSADIENDLSIGVHGPAAVHAVLLPE